MDVLAGNFAFVPHLANAVGDIHGGLSEGFEIAPIERGLRQVHGIHGRKHIAREESTQLHVGMVIGKAVPTMIITQGSAHIEEISGPRQRNIGQAALLF